MCVFPFFFSRICFQGLYCFLNLFIFIYTDVRVRWITGSILLPLLYGHAGPPDNRIEFVLFISMFVFFPLLYGCAGPPDNRIRCRMSRFYTDVRVRRIPGSILLPLLYGHAGPPDNRIEFGCLYYTDRLGVLLSCDIVIIRRIAN